MKTFVKKSFIFVIVVLIISFLFQQLIFLLFRKIDVGDLGVVNRIIDGKINSDILICGSSRSYVGIDPNTIYKITGFKTFNISLNGSRLGIQLPLLKTYLKHNKEPKIIIQEVGPESFTPVDIVYAPYKYLPYLDEEELYQGLKKVDHDFWIQKYIPISNFIYFNTDFQKVFFKDFYFTLEGKKDYLLNGYNPHSSAWTINEQEFLDQNHVIHFAPNGKGRDYLIELIKICRRLDIKLVLTTTPEYYKINNVKFNSKVMIKTYNEISRKYNVPYLNYFRLPISKEKKYFYNFTHLNKDGAKVFSNIMAYDLIDTDIYNVLFGEKPFNKSSNQVH